MLNCYAQCLEKEVLLFEEERAVWTPPESLSISEWVEKYRVLTKPPAEEPGPLRLARTPYITPVLNAAQHPGVETIVLCKSAQIAGTEAMLSIVAYFLHQDPCSAMVVMADKDTATYMSRERIQSIFTASHKLSEVYVDEQATRYELTLSNGAYLVMAWASSVSKLASRPVRVLVLDETDKPGYYVKSKEGDPISLAIQRTETFYNRKILMLSTPTTEDGNIWSQLKSCDAVFDWHVPCPYCGQFQPLRWNREMCVDFTDGEYRGDDGKMHRLGQVVWEGGGDATDEQIAAAGYECGECGAIWSTTEKDLAVQKGKMVPREPVRGEPRKVGFHINRLYSLLGKSGNIPKLVRDWLDSENDIRKKQAFINSALAEPWIPHKKEKKENEILELRDGRPPGIVPSEGVLAITAGIDTQDYGFYYVIRAWGEHMTSWLLRYGFVQTFEAIDQVYFESSYRDASGVEYMIHCGLIDAMGHRTAAVYQFCRDRVQIKPAKGEQRLKSPFTVSKLDAFPDGKPIPGGLLLYRINTNYFKDEIFNKLNVSQGDPGAFYLHRETGEDYAAQLVAEFRNEAGFWEQIGSKPNHYLDCEVMAMAAAHIIGVPFMAGSAARREQQPEQPVAQHKSKKRRAWFDERKGWFRT